MFSPAAVSRFPGAVNFGVSGSVSSTVAIPAIGAFTICGWAYKAVAATDYGVLISLEVSGNYPAQLYTSSANDLITYNNTAETQITATLPTAKWFFFVLRSDGTNLTGAFSLLGSSQFTSASSTASGVSATSVNIGNDTSGSYPWPGAICDVRVFDHHMTAAEVLQERDKLTPTGRRVNRWWRLEDPFVGNFDASGKGRHGTKAGTLTAFRGHDRPDRIITHSVPYSATGGVSVALVGQSSATTMGLLVVGHSQSLAGQAYTAALGAVAPELQRILAGHGAVSIVGGLGVLRGTALNGGIGTFSTGNVGVSSAIPLASLLVSITAGVVTAQVDSDINIALTGLGATASTGALTPEIVRGLSGSSFTASGGVLSPSASLALLASLINAATGSLGPAVSGGLLGGTVTIASGALIPTRIASLSGGSITFAIGTLTAVGGSASATITIKAGSWFRYRIVA